MKAALFDLDGVLIDTEGTYSKFWGEMGRRWNVPCPDFADRIKGTTLPQILSAYFPADKHRQIMHELEEFEEQMEYRLMPGVEEYLGRLRSARVPCAIVTSSGDDKMAHLWAQHPGLREYFAAVITDKDVTRSKPDPEPYLVAAQRLRVPIADCWVYEDSFNGLLSARRAGAYVVGLATTNPAESIADKADIVVKSLAEL